MKDFLSAVALALGAAMIAACAYLCLLSLAGLLR